MVQRGEGEQMRLRKSADHLTLSYYLPSSSGISFADLQIHLDVARIVITIRIPAAGNNASREKSRSRREPFLTMRPWKELLEDSTKTEPCRRMDRYPPCA